MMVWNQMTEEQIRTSLLEEFQRDMATSSAEDLKAKYRQSDYGPVKRSDVEGLPTERVVTEYVDQDGAVTEVAGCAGFDGNSEQSDPQEKYDRLRASPAFRRLLGEEGKPVNGGTGADKMKKRFTR